MYIIYIIYPNVPNVPSRFFPPCPFRPPLQESHAARLSKIALRLRPELLRYLLDRTITADVVGDDPDTTVTVQSFLCHFDRSSRSCLVAIKNRNG